MSTLEKRKPQYNVLKNGFIIPRGFDPERFEESISYVPEADDVFLCTYPKCGTTWTQCILHLLRSGGVPLEPGRKICDVIPHLEDDGRGTVEALPRPRVIKTHLPYDMLPKSRVAKYIYVVRNPKDCCVSFFYHTKGFDRHYNFADGRFDDYFELFLAGQVDFGDYFDHLLSYLPRRGDANMLFLLYEDMKSDIRGCIMKMARFLGDPFLRSAEDPGVLDRIVRNSDFGAMKATPSLWSSEQVGGSPGFIRKGVTGDWRSHFTERQSRAMDEKFKLKLGGTEAEHFWEKFDCLNETVH